MTQSRPQTIDTREKIRLSLTKYHPPFIRNCPTCNEPITYTTRGHARKSERKNQICIRCHHNNLISKNHFSLMGKKSVTTQAETRRSKNEIHFANLCKQEFSNVETNVPLFNGWDADVIIHDKKIAVLWNGVWHHKKVKSNHSVCQVQNRDKIKMNEIVKFGYVPYVIKDGGRQNYDFVESEFKKFLLTLN